jgi:alkylation response protein AidB-like acyl-CoA dehydrogenase
MSRCRAAQTQGSRDVTVRGYEAIDEGGCRAPWNLEATRSLIWRATVVENDPEYDYAMGSAAKVFAAEAAVRVCLSAMEIHGGLAIMYRPRPACRTDRRDQNRITMEAADD